MDTENGPCPVLGADTTPAACDPSGIFVSKNMRRNVIGQASLYREAPNMKVVDVRSSSFIQEGGPGTTSKYRIHPLCRRHCSPGHEWHAPSEFACWHCCHTFDGAAMYAPHSEQDDDIISVYGNFCSLPCAKRHIIDTCGFKSSIQLMLLSRIARDVYGMYDPIMAAPPRICLAMFGGEYSIEDFRGSAGSPAPTVYILEPPFTPHTIICDTTHQTCDAGAAVGRGVPKASLLAENAKRQPSAPEEPHHPTVWSIKGLRRPQYPMQLPRAVAQEQLTPSMLERFVATQDEGLEWSTGQNHRGSVASCTPSVHDVQVAAGQKVAAASACKGPSGALARFAAATDSDE